MVSLTAEELKVIEARLNVSYGELHVAFPLSSTNTTPGPYATATGGYAVLVAHAREDIEALVFSLRAAWAELEKLRPPEYFDTDAYYQEDANG